MGHDHPPLEAARADPHEGDPVPVLLDVASWNPAGESLAGWLARLPMPILGLGAAWLLRQSREVFHPWYAHPTRFLIFLIAAGLTAPWYLTRLMRFLPAGLQSLRTPAAVWALILPIWAALAA